MLCENCHRHDATCHLTTIVGDVTTHRDLCGGCYEKSEGKIPEPAVTLKDVFIELPKQIPLGARCMYCGGQPYPAGTGFLASAAGVPKLMRICLPCSAELGRYIEAHLPGDFSELSAFEKMAALRRIFEDAEKHMKQWVSQKGPR